MHSKRHVLKFEDEETNFRGSLELNINSFEKLKCSNIRKLFLKH